MEYRWIEEIDSKTVYPGYAITVDGHRMHPHDVITKLRRLDYLEKKIKREDDC